MTAAKMRPIRPEVDNLVAAPVYGVTEEPGADAPAAPEAPAAPDPLEEPEPDPEPEPELDPELEPVADAPGAPIAEGVNLTAVDADDTAAK